MRRILKRAYYDIHTGVLLSKRHKAYAKLRKINSEYKAKQRPGFDKRFLEQKHLDLVAFYRSKIDCINSQLKSLRWKLI